MCDDSLEPYFDSTTGMAKGVCDGEGAGAAQELAKGSSTAGVVSLDATCFGEGNGLSRHIDLSGGGGNDARSVRIGRYARRAMCGLLQRLCAFFKNPE